MSRVIKSLIILSAFLLCVGCSESPDEGPVRSVSLLIEVNESYLEHVDLTMEELFEGHAEHVSDATGQAAINVSATSWEGLAEQLDFSDSPLGDLLHVDVTEEGGDYYRVQCGFEEGVPPLSATAKVLVLFPTEIIDTNGERDLTQAEKATLELINDDMYAVGK